jgi:hypothetical protein
VSWTGWLDSLAQTDFVIPVAEVEVSLGTTIGRGGQVPEIRHLACLLCMCHCTAGRVHVSMIAHEA